MGNFTAEIFYKDISEHTVKIIHDDGLNRHIRFSKPGTFNMYFDLITWDNHLCICGDMGTEVYSRIEDMFNFFIGDKTTLEDLKVNVGYWTEKLQAESRFGKLKEFSIDTVKEYAKSQYEDYCESEGLSQEEKDELWEDIDRTLSGAEHQHQAYEIANDYYYTLENGNKKFKFYDVFEWTFTQYTYHHLWLLHAIPWGILKYREYKNGTEGNQQGTI